MAALRASVAPEREDLTVECRDCRCTLPASESVVQENVSHSDRGVLSVTRHYYCSDACAEQLALEESSRSTAIATDGGEEEVEQRNSYMLIPSMDEHPTRHEAVGALALSDDERVVVVHQPSFKNMFRGGGR